MTAPDRLNEYLAQLAETAKPGEKMPTVRDLMARFGVSQSTVQKATERLKALGLISAETGRGTYFRGRAEAGDRDAMDAQTIDAADQVVLFLRRSTSIQRGRRVLEQLQARLEIDGCRVLEVSYTDSRDAIRILKTMPPCQVCVIQSSFETISIEMLNAVRQKAGSIIVDGAALAGTEVNAIGLEWGSAIDVALAELAKLGHSKVGFVLSSNFLLALEIGRIRFDALMPSGPVIKIPAWPHQAYEELAANAIAELKSKQGQFPVSALIIWGIENGTLFREKLESRGIEIPRDLSVVFLGRTDLANEHGSFFATCGISAEAHANALHETILDCLESRRPPYGIRFLKPAFVPGQSCKSKSRFSGKVAKEG